jgi:hypothetical protein
MSNFNPYSKYFKVPNSFVMPTIEPKNKAPSKTSCVKKEMKVNEKETKKQNSTPNNREQKEKDVKNDEYKIIGYYKYSTIYE